MSHSALPSKAERTIRNFRIVAASMFQLVSNAYKLEVYRRDGVQNA